MGVRVVARRLFPPEGPSDDRFSELRIFQARSDPERASDSPCCPVARGGEQVFVSYKGLRDFIVFTSRRIIAVNIQGVTGKKKDFTSLPYAKIQAFSVETAGTFDLDAELELWFSGLGRVKFEFKGSTDVAYLNRLIASYVL